MTERSLDAAVVRATYATAATYRQSPDPVRVAAFDRFIASIKAEAWQRGYDAGEECILDAENPDHKCINNPYLEADRG